MSNQLEIDWAAMLEYAGPYPLEAFEFVREGLNYTVDHVHAEVDPEALDEIDRHINGSQLCVGLRDYAIERFGLMAPAVLSHWHVRRTEDFGRIVFAMIEYGLMSKTDEDTLEDFRSVYDFAEAFSEDQLLHFISSN